MSGSRPPFFSPTGRVVSYLPVISSQLPNNKMLKVFQNLRAKRKRRHTLSHPPTTTTSSTGRLLLL